ncbi:MAG: DUF4179 domain-containing protein [Paraclostridium sp.]
MKDSNNNNFFDHIDISAELDNVIESGIQVAVLEKRRRRIKIISLSISVFIFSSLIVFNTTAFASVKDFFISIPSYFGVSNNLNEYKASIGSSVSNNGYTVTVNEALVNENELVVSSTIKSDNGPISSEINLRPTIVVNGKKLSYDSDEMLEYEDDVTINSISTYRFKDELIGDLKIEIQYESLCVNENSEARGVKGSWNFVFDINSDTLKNDSIVIELNKVITLNSGITIDFREYKGNAFNTTIKTLVTGDIASLDVKLIGEDNLGNSYEFIVSKLYLDENYNGSVTFALDTENSEINSDATELKLYPYYREFDSNENFNRVDDEIVINLR